MITDDCCITVQLLAQEISHGMWLLPGTCRQRLSVWLHLFWPLSQPPVMLLVKRCCR